MASSRPMLERRVQYRDRMAAQCERMRHPRTCESTSDHQHVVPLETLDCTPQAGSQHSARHLPLTAKAGHALNQEPCRGQIPSDLTGATPGGGSCACIGDPY